MIVDSLKECPKSGDLVLVQGKRDGADDNIELYRVAQVKLIDGEMEVILFPRRNIWFGWKQYLGGTSWVRDIQGVIP